VGLRVGVLTMEGIARSIRHNAPDYGAHRDQDCYKAACPHHHPVQIVMVRNDHDLTIEAVLSANDGMKFKIADYHNMS
jgi:hypothetical protein